MNKDLHFTRLFSLLFTVVLAFFGTSTNSFAQSQASADATITAVVLPSLGIAKSQDMNFGAGSPGDGARVLAPSNSAQAASFQVRGASNAFYNISLPADGTVTLRNETGATIAVNRFDSLPKSSGVLTQNGEQVLSIGATRGAIDLHAPVGTYTGSFTVTVTYQ